MTESAPPTESKTNPSPLPEPSPSPELTAPTNDTTERRTTRSRAQAAAEAHSFDIPFVLINVEAPNGKVVKVETTSADCILDIRQFLLDCPETCDVTAYHLELPGGIILNDYVELSEYPDLINGASPTVRIVPDFYDERSARIHVRRLRELLVNPPAHVAVSFIPAMSTPEPTPVQTNGQNKVAKKKNKKGKLIKEPVIPEPSPNNAAAAVAALTRLTDPNAPVTKEELDLAQLLAEEEQGTTNPSRWDTEKFSLLSFPEHTSKSRNKRRDIHECVRNITFSPWNPPPGNRRLRGDLLYLEITSLEGHILMITSSVDGFYLNQSTVNRFDPTPAEAPYKSHTLVDLLKKASPLFNARFTRLLNRKVISHPFESTEIPRPVHDWCAPAQNHTYDWNRSEDALLSTFGMDARGVLRDWNEEYQSCHDLSRNNLQERIMRDRTRYRVYTDFVDAATKGAVAVIHGHIPAVNPMDPPRTHVFIYNNIFFSFAIDGRDQYTNIGGDRVAYVNAKHDLKGIQALLECDIPELYTLATTLIDYRGHRIIAQSIIPGIFHGDRASKHVYGSMDQGVAIEAKPEFHALMSKAAEKLHLAEHQVVDSNNKTVSLYTCVDSKGIIGSDGRSYLLDLVRMTPRDANYSNYLTHPTSLIRKELITLYCRKQAVDKLFVKRDADGKPIIETDPENKAEADAEQAAKTASEEGADLDAPYIKLLASIRFNPDTLTNSKSGDATDVNTSSETTLRSLSTFLVDEQIPGLITSLSTLEASPADGAALTRLMHDRGINIRYLGIIATRLQSLHMLHLVHLCHQQMILRGAKQLLITYMKQVEPDRSRKSEHWFLAPLISRFLSSLVGPHCAGNKISTESLESAKQRQIEEKDPSRRSTKRNPSDPLTPVNIWTSIRSLIQEKYGYDIASCIEMNAREKLSMLRELCLKIGIQLVCRDYDLSPTSSELSPITVDDILDVFPVVKSLQPTCRDAYDLLESGRAYLAQSRLNAAYSYLNEALSLHTQVYGPMHESTAICYATLALTCYHATEYAQAVDFQQRAVIIYERVMGVDHTETAHAHMNLALFLHSITHFDAALTHAKRALFLFELISGPNHPDTAAAHINVAMIYQDTGRVPLGLAHLQQALQRNTICLGAEHTQVALSHHTIAIAYSLLGGFRLAMQHEKIAKTIYTNVLGKQHPRVTQSVYWLNQFTAGAVKLAQTGTSSVPAQIQRTSPLTWVSHRSSTPFKGRLTMNDVLQLFETAASRSVEHPLEEHIHTHTHDDVDVEPEDVEMENETEIPTTNGQDAQQKKRDKRRKQKAKAKPAGGKA